MKKLIFMAFIAISNCLFAQNAAVSVTGSWTKTIRSSDLTTAGSDYVGTYDSEINQTLVTVTSNNKNKEMSVSVRKEDDPVLWHPNLVLQIRRTDNNNVNSREGTLYQTITNFDSIFFYTKGNANIVPIQYRIIGISVLLPVQSYSTTIMYTVMHI